MKRTWLLGKSTVKKSNNLEEGNEREGRYEKLGEKCGG